jgi:chromosomal replication initiation ATPase DnaA
MENKIKTAIKELNASLALSSGSCPFEWRRTMQNARDVIHMLEIELDGKKRECIKLAIQNKAARMLMPKTPGGIDKLDELQASFDCLIGIVARLYKVSVPSIVSPNRKTELVKSRIIIVNLFRNHYGYDAPFKWMGDRLGGRDHSSIMHYMNIINDKLDDNDNETMMTASLLWTRWMETQKPGDETRLSDV